MCITASIMCAAKHEQSSFYGGDALNIWIDCLVLCCHYPSVDLGKDRKHIVTNVTKKLEIPSYKFVIFK